MTALKYLIESEIECVRLGVRFFGKRKCTEKSVPTF